MRWWWLFLHYQIEWFKCSLKIIAHENLLIIINLYHFVLFHRTSFLRLNGWFNRSQTLYAYLVCTHFSSRSLVIWSEFESMQIFIIIFLFWMFLCAVVACRNDFNNNVLGSQTIHFIIRKFFQETWNENKLHQY